MLFKKILVSAICALGFTASAHAGVTYTSAPNGNYEYPLGVPDTTTFGQVFTVPADGNTRLDSFSFYLSGTLLKAYGGVAAWTGDGQYRRPEPGRWPAVRRLFQHRGHCRRFRLG
jgi:hypothetical protein